MLMHNRGGGFMVILWSVLKSSMRIHRNGTRVLQRCSILEIPTNQIIPPRDSNTLPGRLFISQATTIACARASRMECVSVSVRLRNTARRLYGCDKQWLYLVVNDRFTLDIKFESGLRRALVTGERNRQFVLSSRAIRSCACIRL